MVTLIVGKKGSGKTKKLIERANEAVKTSDGNVVVIEKGLKLTYDISHQARLVDSDSYNICGMEALAGFISGYFCGFHIEDHWPGYESAGGVCWPYEQAFQGRRGQHHPVGFCG